MTTMGKQIRLSRIFRNGRAVMVPLDDGLISGPERGLRRASEKIEEIVRGGANAILGFKGMFDHSVHVLGEVGRIVNLTASTSLSSHTRKVLIGGVEQALYLGFDAVAVHVNISSKYESEMLHTLGKVSIECERTGMPLLGLMYPRSENSDGTDENYYAVKAHSVLEYARLVRHAARVGTELGCDIIKTQYTGSIESFASVVESCWETPIIVAGGPLIEEDKALQMASEVMQAGAAGVCFGRNSYNRDDTARFVHKLVRLVHENATLEEIVA